MRDLAVDQIAPNLVRWLTDPVEALHDIWPGVKPEPFQEEGLRAVFDHGRVSIRSGHGVGKSSLDAWAVIIFMLTHYPCKVPICSPTKHQLSDVLIPEITAWWRAMPPFLRNLMDITAERFYLRNAPESNFAAFRTGNKANPEALQGFHSQHVLFVLDEASGIPDVVFEVAEGALSTHGARVLMTSNPTRLSGYFFDSHHLHREHWHTMRVACHESSRVSKRYIQDMAERYGEDSNVFKIRVMGEFPRADSDAAIPMHLVEAAIERDVAPTSYRVVWGLDVARFGDDDSALARRAGNVMPDLVMGWHGLDTMATVGRVYDLYRDAMAKGKEFVPSSIMVDSIGIGAGVVDRLRELGLPARGINVAESPSGDNRFMRLRDQLWWRAREWFEGLDVSMVDDARLISEMTSVRYKMLSSGKISIEQKDEYKKRVSRGRSPDYADSFMLTFASGIDERIEDSYSPRREKRNRSWRSS